MSDLIQPGRGPQRLPALRRGSLLLALVALTLPLPSRGDDAVPATADLIRVNIEGLRSDKGIVACLLFTTEDGYPNDADKAVQRMRAVISDHRAMCEFDAVRAGAYAVAFIHDENENGKLDTNFLGIPKEGLGASNDAKARFGPPSWKDAKFEHVPGTQILTLHAQYF